MKKTTFRCMVMLFIIALFAACTQPPEVIPGYEGLRLNPDFLSDVNDVQDFMKAMETGDQAGMDMHMHETFFVNGPATDDYYTRHEFMDRSLYVAEHFDEPTFSGAVFYSFICDEYEGRPDLIGKWVMTWGSSSFRYKATGAVIEFPYHYAFRIRDGKIDFMGRYYDRQDRSLQLGYTLMPPAPAEE